MATKPIDTDTSTDETAPRHVDADGAQDAFASSFESNEEAPPPAAPAPAKPAAPAASPAAGPAPAAAPKPDASKPPADAPVDPYAGLPKEVREQLAEVPALKHALHSMNGRYLALERQLKELSNKAQPASAPGAAPAAPASKAAKRAKREAIRGELVEVAEAMDELEEALAETRSAAAASQAAPAPAPADPGTNDEEEPASFKALTAVDKDWQTKLRSTEFALWLTQQSPEYADNVRMTGEAAVISSALAKFDHFTAQARVQHEAREAERQRVESERNNRVAAAASSRRGSPRPPPTSQQMDETEAEFEKAFEKAG